MVAVELAEYESREVELPRSAAMAIRAAAGTRLTVAPADDPGRWRIQAGSHVGTVVVAGAQVLIKPKVATANLFHLLGWSTGLDFDPNEIFGYATQPDLLASMAGFYARTLERSLARGVVRRYVEHEDRLVALRGRVNIAAQVRRGGLPTPIACHFDEYTADITLNRILREAALRLMRITSLRSAVRGSLMRSVARLDEVSALQPGDLAAPSRWTRLDVHARPAEQLARPILKELTIDHRTGHSPAATFLVDMNTVFEQYLEHQLRTALRGTGYEVTGQASSHLDVGRRVGIRPDVVIKHKNTTVFVADAKYKLTPTGLGRDRDYYQLLAYCQVLHLRQGALVYCHDDGDAPVARHIDVANDGPRLRTEALSLAGTAAEIDGRVSDLARRMVAWSRPGEPDLDPT